MLQLLFLGIWSIFAGAESINIRGLSTEGIELPPPIPCNPNTIGLNCICPGNCLTYYNSTGGCHPNDCWMWNKIKNQCEEDDREFIPAIILQSIPLTGAFGSGFGNMGRWDIFGTYMIVMFGGCAFICCCGMGCACASKNSEDSETWVKLGTKCGSTLLSIAIISMWIWGIVVIANKEVEAPWTDWKGNEIMCPLVG